MHQFAQLSRMRHSETFVATMIKFEQNLHYCYDSVVCSLCQLTEPFHPTAALLRFGVNT